VAKGVITEDRPGGFIAYLGKLPNYTDAERKALIEGLRTQARENRAKARQQARI
jgi:hypothetical protein